MTADRYSVVSIILQVFKRRNSPPKEITVQAFWGWVGIQEWDHVRQWILHYSFVNVILFQIVRITIVATIQTKPDNSLSLVYLQQTSKAL